MYAPISGNCDELCCASICDFFILYFVQIENWWSECDSIIVLFGVKMYEWHVTSYIYLQNNHWAVVLHVSTVFAGFSTVLFFFCLLRLHIPFHLLHFNEKFAWPKLHTNLWNFCSRTFQPSVNGGERARERENSKNNNYGGLLMGLLFWLFLFGCVNNICGECVRCIWLVSFAYHCVGYSISLRELSLCVRASYDLTASIP